MNSENFWKKVLSTLHTEGNGVLITVVEHSGSVPGVAGAKAFVTETSLVGTIGGGLAEATLVDRVRSSTPSFPEQTQFRHTPDGDGTLCSGVQRFVILPIDTSDSPMIEGIVQAITDHAPATLRYSNTGLSFYSDATGIPSASTLEPDWHFEEVVGDCDVLTIIGGGHVGLALSRIATTLGVRVRVLDNRTDVPTMAENTWASERKTVEYSTIDRSVPAGERSYVVIMTHGHEHDLEVLRALLHHNLRYLAMLGSRAKVAKLFAGLRTDGVSDELLDKVRAPAGLPIGSHTPEEIAVSIAAEIIAERNRAKRE